MMNNNIISYRSTIHIIILLLSASSIYAQQFDRVRLDSLYQYCLPLVDQEKLYSYGPPSTPNIKLDEETLKNYEQKLHEGLLDADGLYELAYLNYQFSNYDVAISLFKKSRDLGDYSTKFYPTYLSLHIAENFVKLEKFQKAKYYYKTYNDPYYLKLFDARIAKRQEDYKLAEILYLEAQAINLFEVMNTEPFKELALMYKKLGDYEKASFYAIRYCNCLKYENENPESMWGLAPNKLEEAEELVHQINILYRNQ